MEVNAECCDITDEQYQVDPQLDITIAVIHFHIRLAWDAAVWRNVSHSFLQIDICLVFLVFCVTCLLKIGTNVVFFSIFLSYVELANILNN